MRKKFLIILFCIFSVMKINTVYASTIEVSTSLDNPLMQLIEVEKRYMWYKEILEDLGYHNNTSFSLENLYIDKDDYVLEYSDWKKYTNEDTTNLEIRKWYNYQTILPLKNIEITSDKNTEISEIEILVNNENVNYNVACTECSVYERTYLNDKKIDEGDTYKLNRRGKILLVLDEEYPINQIEIKIYKKSLNNEKFKLCFTKEQYKYDSTILKDNLLIDKSYNSEIKMESFKVDATWSFNAEYSEINKTLDYIENSWHTKVSTYEEYRNIIKKYHCYNIKKEYLDGYYKDNPLNDSTLKKDEMKFMNFYKYEFLNQNLDEDNLLNDYYTNQGINIPNLNLNSTDFTIDDFENLNNNKLDTNGFEIYNNLNLSNESKEEIPKIDVSNFKTKKVENNNISEYFNSKNLKIAGFSLAIILLIILFINSRYRKS